MKYIELMKYIKHFSKVTASAKSSRPILKGIHYTKDHVYVTDSHRAYCLTENPTSYVDVTIDPKKEIPIDGNYPSVDSIFKSIESISNVFTVKLNVKEARAFLRSVDALHKSLKSPTSKRTVYLTVDQGTFTMSFTDHSVGNYKYDMTYSQPVNIRLEQSVSFLYDLKYILELFEMFYDFDFYSLEVMGKLDGVSTLMFSSENLKGIIAPLKKGGMVK